MKVTRVRILILLLVVGVLLAWSRCSFTLEGRIRSVENGLSESPGSPFWKR
jgi:hypothetical protein